MTNLPSVEEFKQQAIDYLKTVDQHPLAAVFGVAVDSSCKVHVLDAWTGSGKTRGLLEWLASNYKNYNICIAYPEIRLALEAVVQFRDFVDNLAEQGLIIKSAASHLSKSIEYVFNIKDEHITALKKSLKEASNEEDKALIRKCLNLAAHIKDVATSNLKRRESAIRSCKIVVTTHASTKGLLASGFLTDHHLVYDESPADFYETSLPVKDRAVEDLEINTESVLKFAGDSINSWKKSWIAGIASRVQADIEVAAKDGEEAKTLSYSRYFYDLNKFNCKSVSVLTAFAKGTSTKELEIMSMRAGGRAFGWYESPRNAELLAEAKNRLAYHFEESLNVSCSVTAHAGNKLTAVIRKFVAEFVTQEDIREDVMIITHGKYADDFDDVPCVKLNQTGMNSLRSKTVVVVDSLGFSNPISAKMDKAFYGEAYDEFIKDYLGAGLLQSIYRSNLRVRGGSQISVVFYDVRVQEYIQRFVK